MGVLVADLVGDLPVYGFGAAGEVWVRDNPVAVEIGEGQEQPVTHAKPERRRLGRPWSAEEHPGIISVNQAQNRTDFGTQVDYGELASAERRVAVGVEQHVKAARVHERQAVEVDENRVCVAQAAELILEDGCALHVQLASEEQHGRRSFRAQLDLKVVRRLDGLSH